MDKVQRKITYKLYPSKEQAEHLTEMLGLHCRLYNALLEEHERCYEEKLPSYSYNLMAKDLTAWRARIPNLKDLNAQSMQNTAKRVDRAFQAFFRRVKSGETPGYPRYKSFHRYPGWGYNAHGDGWRFFETPRDPKNKNKPRTHCLRISGVGEIRVRGKGRFEGTPKTAEVLHKHGSWYVSITFDTNEESVARVAGTETAAFDWGISKLLTIAKSDGSIEEIENPKILKKRLDALAALQRTISKEQIKTKVLAGLGEKDPIPKGTKLLQTPKLKRLYKQLGALHHKVANERHDFYHKLSALLVKRFGFLATEQLDIKAMTKKPEPIKDEATGEFLPNGANQKAQLNRNILDTAPAKLLKMITTKAGEAASVFTQAETKKLKPTQRCHCCGTLVPKELSDRWHTCPACYIHCGRDVNAAKTILRWFLEGNYWLDSPRAGTVLPYTIGTEETPSKLLAT